jgi:hypothetical protein
MNRFELFFKVTFVDKAEAFPPFVTVLESLARPPGPGLAALMPQINRTIQTSVLSFNNLHVRFQKKIFYSSLHVHK